MRHVSVLQRDSGFLVEFRSVGAKNQQRDGEVVEFHGGNDMGVR